MLSYLGSPTRSSLHITFHEIVRDAKISPFRVTVYGIIIIGWLAVFVVVVFQLSLTMGRVNTR